MIRAVLLTIALAFWRMSAVFAQVSEDLLEHTGIPEHHQVSLTPEVVGIEHSQVTDIPEKHQLLLLPSLPVFSGIPGPTLRWVGNLQWSGASQQEIAFMRRVYTRQMERAATKAIFQPTAIGENMVPIESGQSALPEAAKACRAMLKAARQSRGATRFGVLSAYRSARKQFVNWQSNFPEYYRRTANERRGVLGDGAVEGLAEYIEQRLASPGYSLHNGGIAIDFMTREGGREFSAFTRLDILSGWKRTWLFHWLRENAGRFRFFQNAEIDEPWHWEYRPLVHALPTPLTEVHIPLDP